MIEFSIQGDGQKISIAICGYENDQAEDVSDANWLSCKIKVKVDPFFSEFDASLTTQDFSYFYDDLNRMLEKLEEKICFQTDEGWIEISLEPRSLGKVVVSGIVRPPSFQAKTTLTFKFETDQSYLSKANSDLKHILKEFPVKN